MSAIKPHAQQGNIYHLEKCPMEDLRVLYSSAKAHIAVADAEGFDFTPLEAMQCDCPTLVSDIPVHKEILGEASLYCDPYSIDSICEGLVYLLDESRYAAVSEELKETGREQVKRYTTARAGDQWLQILDSIKAMKKLSF
jgi:glycosyltransferase involved in cell wall biosynthesis